jgi:hypothetical protein
VDLTSDRHRPSCIRVEIHVDLPPGQPAPASSTFARLVEGRFRQLQFGSLREELSQLWRAGGLQISRRSRPRARAQPHLRLVEGRCLDLTHVRGEEVLVLASYDAPGPRRPGLWACILAAQALARHVGGTIVDPDRAGLGGVRVEDLAVPADARVRLGRHICVPTSPGPGSGSWLSTLGMGKFGLPELELHRVPTPQVESGARLMAGLGQSLLERTDLALCEGRFPGVATLTLRDLQRALGLRPMPSAIGAKEWTRVGLRTRRVLPGQDPRLELCPPPGYRGSRDDWMAFALADLVGPPRRYDAAQVGLAR